MNDDELYRTAAIFAGGFKWQKSSRDWEMAIGGGWGEELGGVVWRGRRRRSGRRYWHWYAWRVGCWAMGGPDWIWNENYIRGRRKADGHAATLRAAKAACEFAAARRFCKT